MKQFGWLLGVLLCSNAFSAGEVEIPLLAETAHIHAAIGDVLELDEAGESTLGSDACNQLRLSDLIVVPADGRLEVSMALVATAGGHVFGACRGPAPWRGRLALRLTPEVMASGLAIEFVPASIELVRPDGSPGVLSVPAQALADALVVPRMNRVRIDLTEPLDAIDGLIEQLLGPGHVLEQSLVQRTRIDRLETGDAGITAWLAFQVRAIALVDQAPEPMLDASELVQWQTLEDEFDGFLTTIVAALAYSIESQSLRTELLAVLLDARHAIAEALTRDDPEVDPIRELFLTTWDRLRPLLADLESLEAPGLEVDFRLAAFMAGGDVLRALDALGPEYGLEITRDGLRRLARLLLADSAPLSFTPLPLEVDPAFRALFGFDASGETVTATATAVLMRRMADGLRLAGSWLLPTAHASSASPAEALRGLVPRLAILDDYLELVASLLEKQASAWLAENDRMPDRMTARLDPLVRATAWKESCWRQFTGSTSDPQVLRSPIGAVGMMQINGRVWRSVYDLDRLSEEVDYNVNAGIEILTHYMLDYAIRRGEHEQPGGDDNLIKATYAAYNGGPSHLGRYRREDTAARLRAIDNEFWRHYTTIKAEQWPDIASCYAVGG